MARTRQLSELRAEVRQRADIENDPHITDPELTRYINQSVITLYSRIVDLDEGDYLASTVIPTVSGTELYSLPSNFYKLASIPPIADVHGNKRELVRWDPSMRAPLLDEVGWQYGSVGYYRLAASDQISFLPVPDGVFNVTVWYVPALADMSLDTDTFDGRVGWEEWVVLDAAIKCAIKDEKPGLADLVTERDAKWADIRPKARKKDLASPNRVRDVESARGKWDPYGDI